MNLIICIFSVLLELVAAQQHRQQEESSGGAPRLKALMAGVHAIRSSQQGLATRVDLIASNMTTLGVIAT